MATDGTIDRTSEIDCNFGELFARYRAGDRGAYEALVDAYLPLVKITVARLAANLPTHVSREDLYAAGCYGLVTALERFDPNRQARFATYAGIRIRGAALDELRANDFLGRSARDRINKVIRVRTALRQRGESDDPESVAREADLTMDELLEAELSARAARAVSLSETYDGGRRTLEEHLADNAVSDAVATVRSAEIVQRVSDSLDERERRLVALYYDEGLTMKEIGAVMEVSESRVCQMHTAMLMRLRRMLEREGIDDLT